MALYRDNMESVPDATEIVAEGEYHFRISKVTEKVLDDGKEQIALQCKVQNEGPMCGESVFLNTGLEGFGLRVLKTVYEKTGYRPGPSGHDPQMVLDREFVATVVHKDYKGVTYANINPQSIRSLMEVDSIPY